jgi:hypothetical protein
MSRREVWNGSPHFIDAHQTLGAGKLPPIEARCADEHGMPAHSGLELRIPLKADDRSVKTVTRE